MGDTTGTRLQLGRRLGQGIAERRKAFGWTQDQLAERLEVDAETVSRFERGVTLPALVTLEKIAGILKSGIADLLSESAAAPSDQAIRITAWLESLPAADGEFVVAQVKALCDHLQQVRRDVVTDSE